MNREMQRRAADWRNGAIVYQVLVDRFAPAADLDSKRRHYAEPRMLKRWDEVPRKGRFHEEARVWTHELEFWGGDLASLAGRLDYLRGLGVEVVYLNPIFSSLTNHKYDTWDYHAVDPAYGTRDDLKRLAAELHRREMRLVLDGVFNHVGRQSPLFQEASKDPSSRFRKFFRFTDRNPWGYVAWYDVENLPELALEEPAVKDYVWARPESVVQSYLRQEEVDGWRLDVAHDIGMGLLSELTAAAHEARPGSLVVGEIWNYPEQWFPAVDGLINFHGRLALLRMLEGRLPGPRVGEMWATMVADAGLEPMLKSWLVLDNHDTPRLANILKKDWQARMARVLQFTLPGSVCLYYGSELGMAGGEDPEMRAPMRWDLARDDNAVLSLHRRLLALRHRKPALRYGDFRVLEAQRCLAFLRATGSARETVVVIANPTDRESVETLQIRESKFQNHTVLEDALGGQTWRLDTGLLDVTVPAHGVLVLEPRIGPSPKGYDRYDRMP